MAITINWLTKIISIPKSFMTLIHSSPDIYKLDLNGFRLALKDLEDDDWGMVFPDTHRHNTEVTLAGITLSRTVEIINGYTVMFEDGQYAVEAKGANSNLADVMNVNQVSLRTFNTAGLITVSSGSGLSQDEHDTLYKLDSYVKNRKLLSKEGSVWYIIIRNDANTADLRKKALKDKNGSDITDIQAGIMAQELASSV